MKVETFSFDLPEELIAQVPAARRDESRLMILDRGTGGGVHRRFAEFPDQLAPGDLLVLNDTKVLPARLRGAKPTGGRVEVLLLEQVAEAPDGSEWRALLNGGKSIRPGMEIAIEQGLTAIPLERREDVWRVRLVHAGRALRISGQIH